MGGKSRTCVFLAAGLENSAASNLQSLLKAVEKYGIPFRCRSEKGGRMCLLRKICYIEKEQVEATTFAGVPFIIRGM